MAYESPHRLVSQLEERIQTLETEFHVAYWDSQTEATPESEQRRAELELRLRAVKGDAAALDAVNHALGEELHDGVLKRQLQVLRLSLTGNQMASELREEIVALSSSIESDFAAHRPVVGGDPMTDNEIEQVLRESDDDSSRREVWAASKEVGRAVADRVIELARARNQVAHELGFADYYRMGLELQEISEEWLFDMLDALERSTDDRFRQWKEGLDARLRSRFGVTDVMPWHYADPFFQALPPDGRISLDPALRNLSAADLANATFKAWGIDLTGVLDRSDLFPRARKSQHAFCLSVDRSGEDVRILANVVPGERWIEVMLHECGHAAYDVSINRRLPYLLRRPSHTFVTEAIAILSGRLLRDPTWLRDLAGVPSDVLAQADAMLRANRTQSLVFARWGLVMAHFERALYADPEADLNALWWDLVERFQHVKRPPGRDEPDWAAKVHVATAPVYYHNYLLGEMLASQLRDTVEEDCGGFVGNPEAGAWLVDRVFAPGALLRWDALVEGAAGGPFSADAYVAEVNSL